MGDGWIQNKHNKFQFFKIETWNQTDFKILIQNTFNLKTFPVKNYTIQLLSFKVVIIFIKKPLRKSIDKVKSIAMSKLKIVVDYLIVYIVDVLSSLKKNVQSSLECTKYIKFLICT